ncbi:MAG: hypothetical protein H7842_12910, partial [Gammaproteobacteria bacterium SHHR-1]
MAKYIALDANGNLTEQLPVTTSAGAADATKVVQLDASGKLDVTLLPTGIGQDSVSLRVGSNVSAGDFVNIYDNVGIAEIRPADNTVPYRAHGFVLETIVADGTATATVYFEGTNNGVVGLTPGETYFLSTNGDCDTYANVTKDTGDIAQKVGV